MNKKYDVVYLDPPWDYKGQKQHTGKGGKSSGGAVSHYPTVKLSRLKTLPIQEILADDALVFMWVTSPHLDQAIDLVRAWNLKYTTVGFVWNKVKVNPGYYTMSQCEICIIAKHNRIPKPRGSRKERQWVETTLVEHERERHSKKPDIVRDRIAAMFPDQNKVELFARQEFEGWDVWGNEVGSTDELKEHFESHGW